MVSYSSLKNRHVGILKVNGKDFELSTVPLKTVRPFFIEDIVLREVPELRPGDNKGVMRYLTKKVESFIKLAHDQWLKDNNDDEDNEQEFIAPLVRLRVEYSGNFTAINPHRFGQQFINKVANPKDIVMFFRRKTAQASIKVKINQPIMFDDDMPNDRNGRDDMPDPLDAVKMEDLVHEYLNAQQLELLPEIALGEAVQTFVEKDEKDAIKDFVNASLAKTRDMLRQSSVVLNADEIKKQVQLVKKQMADEMEMSVSVEPTKIADASPSYQEELMRENVPKSNMSRQASKRFDILDEMMDDLSSPRARPSLRKPLKPLSKNSSKSRAKVEEYGSDFDEVMYPDKAEEDDMMNENRSKILVTMISDEEDQEYRKPEKPKRGRAAATKTTRKRNSDDESNDAFVEEVEPKKRSRSTKATTTAAESKKTGSVPSIFSKMNKRPTLFK